MPKNKLRVIVKTLIKETSDIIRITLADYKGGELPKWRAGAHIDLYLKNNFIRQYSLSNDPNEKDHYEIAVLKEENGSGGSRFIHENFHEGMELEISKPRNHFSLMPDAKYYILLAGGIGITPIMAMIEELESQKKNYLVYYCTRTIEKTAFWERLLSGASAGKVHIHHDNGDPKLGFDFESVLKEYKHDTSLYYCGPPSFMKAIEVSTKDWPRSSLNYEYFSKANKNAEKEVSKTSFNIKISSTGQVFEVPCESSIIQVLREHNFAVDTSCEDGFCGTCMTRYLEGKPEHRDSVLDEEDRKQFVLICCARSKTPTLVLDL